MNDTGSVEWFWIGRRTKGVRRARGENGFATMPIVARATTIFPIRLITLLAFQRGIVCRKLLVWASPKCHLAKGGSALSLHQSSSLFCQLEVEYEFGCHARNSGSVSLHFGHPPKYRLGKRGVSYSRDDALYSPGFGIMVVWVVMSVRLPSLPARREPRSRAGKKYMKGRFLLTISYLEILSINFAFLSC